MVDIAAGEHQSFAVSDEGQVYHWGRYMTEAQGPLVPTVMNDFAGERMVSVSAGGFPHCMLQACTLTVGSNCKDSP